MANASYKGTKIGGFFVKPHSVFKLGDFAASNILKEHPLPHVFVDNTFSLQIHWRRENETEEAMSPPDTNLLRFLLVFCIYFQLPERCQWLTTSLTGPS